LNWSITYGSQKFIVIGTSLVVVIINIIICIIFEQISKLEKHHTQNDETLAMFNKITIMQFINISFIMLIINFNFEKIPGFNLLGVIPLLQGEYNDFNV